jgi:2-oxo-4-hydroxy-4-carboxy-5-ureidoimidazoline decarboxylase
MKEKEFIARYGGIYEHSPWVAERAAALLDDSADIDVIARVMADCVDNASMGWQLALIRAHQLEDGAGQRRSRQLLAARIRAFQGTEPGIPQEVRVSVRHGGS